MILNSIRARLLLVALTTIALALLATGFGIVLIFQNHLEERVEAELTKHFTQLVAALEVDPQGEIILVQELADPRFQLPLSGLYWQVDLDGKPVARSRSMWDEKISVPTPPAAEEEAHIHELAGPDGKQLFSLERAIFLDRLGQQKMFVVTVGLEKDEINATVLSMTKDMAPALAALGLVLLVSTWLQLGLGLKPLRMIASAVQGIREGSQARVLGDVAEEVQPLVTELNALLDSNEERNRTARQRAADLAHGLRTPLTVLGSLARSIEGAGLQDAAEKIRMQTEHMRHQVERELANTLSALEEKAVWLDLSRNLSRLVNVVSMGTDKDGFSWNIELPKEKQCLITRNDFNEMFGNIIENAQKWGKTCARVSQSGEDIIIEDDGPGVPEPNLARLTERGFSSGGDVGSKQSTGLGLSIVKQLADKNALQLSFEKSELGGLAVRIAWPAEKLRDF